VRKLLRRSGLFLAVISLLICAVSSVAWIRSLHTADEIYFPTSNSTLYHLHSGRGQLLFQRFAQWPATPRFVHTTHPPNQQITPVFSRQRGAPLARRWRFYQFAFSSGATRAVLMQSGSIDFGSPAAPVFQTLASQPFSAPFPFWTLTIPHWSVILLTALLPTFVAVRIARPLFRHPQSKPKEPIDHWG